MTTPVPDHPVPVDMLDERTQQLIAQYDDLQEAADEAAARFDEAKAAIKIALQNAAPGLARLRVEHPALRAPLTLRHSAPIKVDTKRMQADAARLAAEGDHTLAMFVSQYARRGSSWTLARARGSS